MGMRTANDPNCTPLIDKMIGNAFTIVKEVSLHLEEIKYLVDNMQAIIQVGQAEEDLNDIAAAAPAAVANAAAIAAALAQATALLAGTLIGLNASGALVTPTGQSTPITLADIAASETTEIAARVAGDTALATSINTEATTRAAATTAEVIARNNAIAVETTRALAAEVPLAIRTAYGTGADWGTALINWPGTSSYIYALSPDSRMAITGMAQTGDGASTAFPAAIGISGFGFNNLSGGASQYTAWGGYFEGRRYPGVTANTYGAEIDVANLTSVDSAYATPYSFVSGGTWALSLGSGAGADTTTPAFTPKTATAAMIVVSQPSNFNTGIIFAHDSLAGCNGDGTSTANAISLAAGHVIQWWQNSTTGGGYIHSMQTTGPSAGIRFENDRIGLYSTSVLSGPFAAFANTPPATGGTTFELLVNNSSGVTLVGVTLGATDSGGTGFRTLRVPN